MQDFQKKPGITYAMHGSGLELPVIDLSHPAFYITMDETDLFARADRYAQTQARQGPFTRWVQRKIVPWALRGSIIGRGLLRSYGSYLDGTTTYLLKLPPELLGPGFNTSMDRKLVEGLNAAGLSIALRGQDMAETLADALRPLLAAEATRPLHLVNIAGGPSMDSLNALILLYTQRPADFSNRTVSIRVLDLDPQGPQFAAAALKALQADGAPLQGLKATLSHQPYDWSQSDTLEALLRSLPKNSLLGLSSEGGLFDYAADADIVKNLSVSAALGPADSVCVASISSPDSPSRTQAFGGASLVWRSLQDLDVLARQAGWRLGFSRKRPICFVAGLERDL